MVRKTTQRPDVTANPELCLECSLRLPWRTLTDVPTMIVDEVEGGDNTPMEHVSKKMTVGVGDPFSRGSQWAR